MTAVQENGITQIGRREMIGIMFANVGAGRDEVAQFCAQSVERAAAKMGGDVSVAYVHPYDDDYRLALDEIGLQVYHSAWMLPDHIYILEPEQ